MPFYLRMFTSILPSGLEQVLVEIQADLSQRSVFCSLQHRCPTSPIIVGVGSLDPPSGYTRCMFACFIFFDLHSLDFIGTLVKIHEVP